MCVKCDLPEKECRKVTNDTTQLLVSHMYVARTARKLLEGNATASDLKRSLEWLDEHREAPE